MKQNIAFIWADALESGNYQQGIGQLRYQNDFCCLGVLTDMYLKEAGKSWVAHETRKNMFRPPDGDHSALSPEVMAWSGIKSPTAECGPICLPYRNDVYKKSFIELAKVIRENWEKL